MRTQYLQDFVNKTRRYKSSFFCLAASCSYLLAGQPLNAVAALGSNETPKPPSGNTNAWDQVNAMFANCDKSKSLFDRMAQKRSAQFTPFAPISNRAFLDGTDACPGTNIPAGTAFADTGTTIGANNTVQSIPIACNGTFATTAGPDKIYKFVLPALGSRIATCSITVTSTAGNGWDSSVYILTQGGGGCPSGTANAVTNCAVGRDATGCNGTETFSDAQIDALPAGIYYLFIDSFYSAGGGGCGANRHNGNFTLNFNCTTLAPTAAIVGVGGRVTTADGRGIAKATVAVTLPSGQSRTVVTNPFGFYNFEDIEVGQSYVFQVSSKGHVFSNSSQLITVNDSIQDLNFTAEPQGRPGK